MASHMETAATPLDQAFARMQAAGGDATGPAGDDDSARLRYYERLADGLLFLLLDEEPQGSTLRPRVFELEDGPVVLAFDLEERLAEAAGAVVPYAALPGRVIAAQLAGQGVALGVNLGVAPSAFLVSPDAVDWLAATLGRTPAQIEARPRSFHAPKGLPPALIEALDAKLARAAGLAEAAVLAQVRYEDGRQGHMLAFLGALAGAETALAHAAGEALTFSGIEAGEMDVTFLSPTDPATVSVAAAMVRVGLRFDLPQAEQKPEVKPQPPGMDPERPPRLR